MTLDDLYGPGSAEDLKQACGADELSEAGIDTPHGQGVRVGLSWTKGGKAAKLDCYPELVWWQAMTANRAATVWGKDDKPGGLYKLLLDLKPWFKKRGVKHWKADPTDERASKRLRAHRRWKVDDRGVLAMEIG